MTLPLAPLSLPEITTTVSPFLTFIGSPPPGSMRRLPRGTRCRAVVPALASQHLRRKRDDLHELLVAQLAADWTEDARPPRLTTGLDQHCGVLVEPDVGT